MSHLLWLIFYLAVMVPALFLIAGFMVEVFDRVTYGKWPWEM